jgi:parvulin-like peptidyl-prolyl isomerase
VALGCGRASSPDPVILALGEQEARASEFERYLSQVASRGAGPLDPAVRASLLDAWLERRLLVMQARARGLVPAGAGAEQEAAAVQKLLAEEATASVDVSEAEISARYEARREECARPERVTLRQVLVPTRNEARDVRRRLLKEPRSFGALAQTLSRGPEAGAGGLMGTFARGELPPELEKAAFDLQVGRTTDVVESPLGFHVLRVEAREPAQEQPLEECRTRLAAQVRQEKADRAVREYVAGLRARAKVNHEAARARS